MCGTLAESADSEGNSNYQSSQNQMKLCKLSWSKDKFAGPDTVIASRIERISSNTELAKNKAHAATLLDCSEVTVK